MNSPNFYRQPSSSECGPTALRIILSIFGRFENSYDIVSSFPCVKDGWSVSDFCNAAKHFNISTFIHYANVKELLSLSMPFILLIDSHYVVCYKIRKNNLYLADPAKGRVLLSLNDLSDKFKDIVIIECNVTPSFKPQNKGINDVSSAILYILKYYVSYKQYISAIFILAIVVFIAQLILPFIAKAIIDKALNTSSVHFLYILLTSNILLILVSTLGTATQVYILSHLTNRIKTLMLDEYINKTINLSMSFFSRVSIGDLLQRVKDSERIQMYVSNVLFNSIVSILFLIGVFIVLLTFDKLLFAIAICGACLYLIWISFFISQRKNIDLNFWDLQTKSQRHIVDLYNNIFDIKTYSLDDRYIQEWRKLNVSQYKQNIRFLNFTQIQEFGGAMLLQAKNITITFVSCFYVLEGELTLGSLFAIQYLNSLIDAPLFRISSFIDQSQLASISVARIIEYNKQEMGYEKANDKNRFIPRFKNITLKGVSFKYPNGDVALNSFSMTVNVGDKVGIVGPSGSGKSTLLKILSGMLVPGSGEYFLGSMNMSAIDLSILRKKILSVQLQENKIFPGTILNNIIGDDKSYDEGRLIKAVEIASVRREIETLPAAYETKIGEGFKMLSRGQYNRILVARAIYKQASIYIFDEIGAGISKSMEAKMISKIDSLKKDALRIYVSHNAGGLSDSDLIIVLNNGRTVAYGTHEDLMKFDNYYSQSFNVDRIKELEKGMVYE